jgi:hypothetical protein
MKFSKPREAIGLGSAGSLPAVLGSLPPQAGWQPAFPRKK